MCLCVCVYVHVGEEHIRSVVPLGWQRQSREPAVLSLLSHSSSYSSFFFLFFFFLRLPNRHYDRNYQHRRRRLKKAARWWLHRARSGDIFRRNRFDSPASSCSSSPPFFSLFSDELDHFLTYIYRYICVDARGTSFIDRWIYTDTHTDVKQLANESVCFEKEGDDEWIYRSVRRDRKKGSQIF